MLKACAYDDLTVFYFDCHDNKYVAKGGSLANRLNNPGLISSRWPFAKQLGSIGSHKHYAIFPNILFGKDAHRVWIGSKYFDSPLIEIAKEYEPNDPQSYLERLCEKTNFSSTITPRMLSSKDFERLLQAIQTLAGFLKNNDGEFYRLPKIKHRFYSRNRKVESYFTTDGESLTRDEAINRVTDHRLDAVVVHKVNGEMHIRSRPCHHFNKIHFTEKEYGSDKNIEDGIREVGQDQIGQCIWGFINGVKTEPQRSTECAAIISNFAKGQQVWSLVNDGEFKNFFNIPDAIKQTLGHLSPSITRCAHFFKFLIDQSNRSPAQPPIVIIAHSQGALIADLALDHLNLAEQARIHIFTFGGAAFISPKKCHPHSHNYFSFNDPIPQTASKDACILLKKLREGEKRGDTAQKVIEECLQEDLINFNKESFHQLLVDEYLEQRQQFYEEQICKVQNTTVLGEYSLTDWEHAFDTPCYLEKIKEIIEAYNKPY